MQSPEQYELKLDDVRAGYPPGWVAYAAGVVWALQDAGHQVRGLDLMVDGQVPQGAGLSSRVFRTVGCLVGLLDPR